MLQSTIASVILPPNFHRSMPKRLKSLKATDVLLFLLYACDCFAFIPSPFPQLLNLLKEIVVICLQESLSSQDISCVKSLVRDFLKIYQQTFGESSMSHNLHLLRHLHRDLLLFGTVHSHIMFSYEGFNHELKQITTTTFNYDRKQLINFNSESLMHRYLSKLIKHEPSFAELHKKLKELRKKKNPYLKINNFFFPKNGDSYVQLNDNRVGKFLIREMSTQDIAGENAQEFLENDTFSFTFTDSKSKEVSLVKMNDIKHQMIKTHRLDINMQTGKLQKTSVFEKVEQITNFF